MHPNTHVIQHVFFISLFFLLSNDTFLRQNFNCSMFSRTSSEAKYTIPISILIIFYIQNGSFCNKKIDNKLINMYTKLHDFSKFSAP